MFNFGFQMTNIFGIRLSRNKNGKFSNDIYLWHAALQSNFHVIKKRFSVQYIWHWALRLTIFFPVGTERVNSFYAAKIEKISFFRILRKVNFKCNYLSFDASKIGHVWVRCKALFKFYLFSVPDF